MLVQAPCSPNQFWPVGRASLSPSPSLLAYIHLPLFGEGATFHQLPNQKLRSQPSCIFHSFPSQCSLPSLLLLCVFLEGPTPVSCDRPQSALIILTHEALANSQPASLSTHSGFLPVCFHTKAFVQNVNAARPIKNPSGF